MDPVNVVVSKELPLHPGPGEVGRRIVRHGLADVLTWLGEPLGPRPDELTHAISSVDPGNRFDPGVLFVSEEYHQRLRRVAGVAELNHGDRGRRAAAERAWLADHRAHRAGAADA